MIVSVETVAVNDGTTRLFKQDECGYAYRESVFKRELKGLYIVTYVTYRLKNSRSFIWIMEISAPSWRRREENCHWKNFVV